MKFNLVPLLLASTLGRKCWSKGSNSSTDLTSVSTSVSTGSATKCTKKHTVTTGIPGATSTSVVGEISKSSVGQTIPTPGYSSASTVPSYSSQLSATSSFSSEYSSRTSVYSSLVSTPVYVSTQTTAAYSSAPSSSIHGRSSSSESRTSSSSYLSSSSSSSSVNQPSSTPISDVGTSTLQGITYSPYADNGLCHDTNTVYQQLSKVVKLTTNIRLFGADCNQVPNVLDSLVKLNVPGKVLLGIWLRSGDSRYKQELDTVVQALQNPKYQHLISGVAVGNEELFNGASSADIAGKIRSVKAHLSQLGINTPVSTVESYKLWDPTLIDASDVIYSTIYPYYTPSHGDGSIITAVKGAFVELDLLRARLPLNKQLVIAETGWPTSGTAGNTFAIPTLLAQRLYIAQFQCYAKKINLPVYFLEAYDSKWKSGASAEQHFGLLEPNGNLKGNLAGLLIPNIC